MTLKKRLSLRVNRLWMIRAGFCAALGLCLLILVAMIQKDWGRAVRLSCGIYTVAVTFFFVAQLFGFILSQTEYSDVIEAPKFRMLEQEEQEWKR